MTSVCFAVLSTLLCYLELHPSAWIRNLPATYSTCSIKCYGGAPQLLSVANKVRDLPLQGQKVKEGGR